jgi:hypothetical protein
MRVSKEAFDLIVSEEVTSKAHYEAQLRRPEWPGGSSGVTVGIGYDLGQTARETIAEDWRGRVSEAMLSSMLSASGVTGNAAAPLASGLKASIDIPWDVAVAVHRERVLPRWEAMVDRALPNCDRLSPDCFGALVSLTFNRGASFAKDGERYREMRAIKAHLAAGELRSIPGEIRAMKRLWEGQGLDGLLKRRDAEAELFLRGLAASGPTPPPVVTDSGPAPSPVVSELTHRESAGEGRMATGAGLLRRAREHIGEEYVNSHVPKDNPNWKGHGTAPSSYPGWCIKRRASFTAASITRRNLPKRMPIPALGKQM